MRYDTEDQMDEQSLMISTNDTLTPPGRDYWLDDSMFAIDERTGMHYPAFAVQEVSKAFFGHEADWLRWRMRPTKPDKKTGHVRYPDGFFMLDGKPMEFKRKPVVDAWWEDSRGRRVSDARARSMSEKDRRAKFTKRVDIDRDSEAETARYYTLADVERMAHALAQEGIIDGLRLMHIVVMVRCCARLYGVAV